MFVFVLRLCYPDFLHILIGIFCLQVFDEMLDFYHPQINPKRKSKLRRKMIASYPFIGLLNVAIASLKFGLWDHMSSSQANSKGVAVNTCAVDANKDIETAEENTLVANKHVLEDSVGNLQSQCYYLLCVFSLFQWGVWI
ncbi:hypothetical protein Hanom_Chr02g00146501 [Helianthus anomalus]